MQKLLLNSRVAVQYSTECLHCREQASSRTKLIPSGWLCGSEQGAVATRTLSLKMEEYAEDDEKEVGL